MKNQMKYGNIVFKFVITHGFHKCHFDRRRIFHTRFLYAILFLYIEFAFISLYSLLTDLSSRPILLTCLLSSLVNLYANPSKCISGYHVIYHTFKYSSLWFFESASLWRLRTKSL